MSPFIQVQIIQTLVFSPILAILITVYLKERVKNKLERGE
jgi:hypothetical protein